MARENPRSTARIANHPIHPILVPFPIVCFVGTLLTDLAYWRTADMMWADFSAWLLTVGVIVGCITVVVALVETFAVRSPLRGRLTWPYALGFLVALILATLDMFVHTRDAWTSVVPWGLVLSAAIVLVLILTGWMTRETYDAAGTAVTA